MGKFRAESVVVLAVALIGAICCVWLIESSAQSPGSSSLSSTLSSTLLRSTGVTTPSTSTINNSNQRRLQGCAVFDTTKEYHIISRNSGMALRIEGDSTSGGAYVEQQPIDPISSADNWKFLSANSAGHYHIENINSGLAMNVDGNSQTPGREIIQWGASSQAFNDDWCFQPVPGSTTYYTIVASHSGQALDVPGSSTSAGTDLIQWTLSGDINQQFYVEDTNADPGAGCVILDETEQYHITAKHSGKSLSILGDSNIAGTSIAQVTLDDPSVLADRWTLERTSPANNNRYHIVNVDTGLAINIGGNSLALGRRALQWPISQLQANDNFCIKDLNNGYYSLVAQHSDLALDVAYNSQDEDQVLVQYTQTGSDNQQFNLTVVPYASNAPTAGITTAPSNAPSVAICSELNTNQTYHFIVRHTNYSLHVDEPFLQDASNIIEAPAEDYSTRDNWFVESVGMGGHYHIVNANNAKAVNVGGASTEAGANVLQYTKEEATNDNWCFIDLDNGYYEIINQNSQLTLAVTPQSNVIQWTHNDNDFSQQWMLQAVQPRCTEMIEHIPYHMTVRSNNLNLQTEKDPNSGQGGTGNSVKIIQDFPTSQQSDNFYFQKTGTDNYYHIVNELSGRALNIQFGGTNPGSKIIQYNIEENQPNDNWCVEEVGEGYVSIISQSSILALGVPGGSPNTGTQFELKNIDIQDSSQQFLFTSVANETTPSEADPDCATFLTNITYHITAKHSGMGLYPQGGAMVWGSEISQWPVSTTNLDNWMLEDVPGKPGYYHVISSHSGFTMTALGGGLFQYPKDTVPDADDWCFQSVGMGFYQLKPYPSQFVVNVANANPNAFAQIDMSPSTGFAHQHFLLTTAEQVPSGSSGQWEDEEDITEFNLVPAAGANLPDGKMLFWSAEYLDLYTAELQSTHTVIFDPVTKIWNHELIAQTGHDMFCPGTHILPDNSVMVTGGSTSAKVSIYNPTNNSWSVGKPMLKPRGYHAQGALSDGSTFTMGGSWSGGLGGKFGELWNYTTDEWEGKSGLQSEPDFLTADVEGVYRSDNHMWFFEAPNGRLFHAGPSKAMHWIDLAGNGTYTYAGDRGDDDDAMNAAILMYDVGMLLTVGGAPNYANGLASRKAYVIDINDVNNTGAAIVQRTGDMIFPRTFASSAVLPNGQVLIVGGMTNVQLFTDSSAVHAAEIWDPATGEFTLLTSMAIPRTYHSIGLLGKDGRFVAAGGGLCGWCGANHFDAEIFTPPYLLNPDGSLRTRPEILSATQNVTNGDIITVQVDTNTLHTFSLIRLGAATHAINTDLRRIPLAASALGNNTYDMTVPANPSIALPGTYYLFAMNNQGTPSIAETVSVYPA